jgi:DNA repair protein RadD
VILRDYQARSVNDLFGWWTKHQEDADIPLLVLPTAAGKSVICAEIVRQMWDQWPDYRPRTVVLVPSKELAEQNAAKLTALLPDDIHVGFVSASLGKKQHHADVIVATIGSIHKSAHLLGDIKVVVIDECFVAGTKISTPKGQIDIDKVRCGDLVFNTRGVGVVEAVSCRQSAETLLVELDDGTKFECTGNHPIFTEDGWQKAEKLEIGTPLFRIEDMSCLWSRVQTLDQKGRQRKSNFSNVGTILGKAELLLGEVCKEITPDGSECRSTQTNAGNSKKNQASTYSAWRKRAIAAFATVSTASCVGGRMDSRICNQDQSGTFERDISKCVQGGHLLSRKDDLHRIGWGKSWQRREENAGQEERSISCGPRVARVSRIKRESPVLVFNLQVSGHPSYFANGIAAHNCHLVSTKASDAGMYRTFLAKLAQICQFRTVGMTATPFRGNQVWLTDGEDPLFTGIASNVTMRELLDQGFIAPLVPPTVQMHTRIDASTVGISNGDYKVGELSDVVEGYLSEVAAEASKLAADRRKWIAFTPSVANAESLADKLCNLGIVSEVVCGETPALEREQYIRNFRSGEIHCLVTVLALSVGFDVPDVDCIIWCRPTKSPVLYVQGMGRGCRIADGKEDCLVLDFTDTVERLGPVDIIKGRAKRTGGPQEAPFSICPACGDRNTASALICASCGAVIREEVVKPQDAKVSYAALLSAQIVATVTWHDVSRVEYKMHSKPGKPDSVRVDYYDGLLRVASSWQCFDHGGYAESKAHQWFQTVKPDNYNHAPGTSDQLIEWIETGMKLKSPARIATRRNGKFTEITQHEFSRTERHQDTLAEAIE